MNHYYQILQGMVSKVNRQHVQLVLVILALIMFVLAAGAPEAGGGVGINVFGGGTD